jgi:hypothetical protein
MEYLLSAAIACNQLNAIINRLNKKINMTEQQKIEVVYELKNHFKTCTIEFKKQ